MYKINALSPQTTEINYGLTEALLDKGYQDAVRSSRRPPKMLFLVNPTNPLGTCYTPDEMAMAVTWLVLCTAPRVAFDFC